MTNLLNRYHLGLAAVTGALFLTYFVRPIPAAAAGGYLHTSGGKLVDETNQTVVITGINWFGLETGTFAPHGLWSRGYKEMLDQVKQLGFNTIRLPYSSQALDAGSKPNGIDFAKNPDLENLSPLEIMDKIVAYSGQIGLKIILDRHRADSNGQAALWYTDAYSEQRWIADWAMLAKRYAGNPTVIGADLHNEPHDSACWGCGDAKLDWKAAAERCGNAIMAANPNWLIIVEGVQNVQNDWYWWGGNLMGVKDQGVKLSVANRVVYSPHDYPASVNNQPWFGAGNYPANLPALWDNHWGYVQKDGIAPVLLGEFGTRLESTSDELWLKTLTDYLRTHGISWTFWSLNPNSGDTGGILQDDWQTVNQKKMDYIRSIQAGQLPPFSAGMLIPAGTPQPTASPAVSPQPSSSPADSSSSPLTVRYLLRHEWNNTFIADVTVTNPTDQAVDDWAVSWKFGSDQQILKLWEGQYIQAEDAVKVWNAAWNGHLAPHASVTFGLVGTFTGTNPMPTVTIDTQMETIAPPPVTQPLPSTTPSPSVSPTPLPTSSPMPGTTGSAQPISIWWPTMNATMNDTQPLKARIDDLPLSAYTMFWSVDGGQLNAMHDSTVDAPHKQADVDFSGWTWRQEGPYEITFMAKDLNGNEIGRTSTTIRVAP